MEYVMTEGYQVCSFCILCSTFSVSSFLVLVENGVLCTNTYAVAETGSMNKPATSASSLLCRKGRPVCRQQITEAAKAKGAASGILNEIGYEIEKKGIAKRII